MSFQYQYNTKHADDDLEEDEREIKYYEKKLGINRYKKQGKSIPFIKQYGLEDLFEDIERISEDFKKNKPQKPQSDSEESDEEDAASDAAEGSDDDERPVPTKDSEPPKKKAKELTAAAIEKRKRKNHLKRVRKREKKRLEAIEKNSTANNVKDATEDEKESDSENMETDQQPDSENEHDEMQKDGSDSDSDEPPETLPPGESQHPQDNVQAPGTQGRQLHSCRATLRRVFLALDEPLMEKFIQAAVSTLRKFPQAIATKAFQMECLHALQVRKGTPSLEAHVAAFTVCVHVRLRNFQSVGNLGSTLLEALVAHLGLADASANLITCLKEKGNTLLFLAFLYKFGLVSDALLLDILQLVAPAYKNADVCRLLTQVLTEVGVQLRRNHFQGFDRFMRQHFTNLQTSHKWEKSLSVVLRKARQGVYNPKQDPYYALSKKVTRWIDGVSKESYRLSLALKDLLDSEKDGRWWMAGAPTADKGATAKKSKTKVKK